MISPGAAVRVGALHTVPALVPVFQDLLSARRPDLDIVHLADASLLSRAIAGGVTEDVRAGLRGHLAALRDAGAEAVLVTCSSIGEAAAQEAAALGVRLHRVDAPMAAEAVARARAGRGRILVLATLEATLGPTTRLVEEAARDAGAPDDSAPGDRAGDDSAPGDRTGGDSAPGNVAPGDRGPGGAAPADVGTVTVTAHVVAGAAAARSTGDLAAHDRLIADAIADAGDVDVIVLAQASMASGAGDDRRVLTSPESGAAGFVAALTR